MEHRFAERFVRTGEHQAQWEVTEKVADLIGSARSECRSHQRTHPSSGHRMHTELQTHEKQKLKKVENGHMAVISHSSQRGTLSASAGHQDLGKAALVWGDLLLEAHRRDQEGSG